MELSLRCVLGVLLSAIFAVLAFWLGSKVWTGLGVLLLVPAILIGFFIGFFWVEVKFLLRLLLGSLLE